MTSAERVQEEKRRIEAAAAEEERRLQRLGLRWNYDQSLDEMGRGTIRTAIVRSRNEIRFGFPYQGAQRGRLELRIHPKYGKDVILTIERGQFLCGIEGCDIDVKFDDEAWTFHAVGPADHSTNALFLRGYGEFLARVRRSKKVYIEAPFYREATRVFEFDISGIKW